MTQAPNLLDLVRDDLTRVEAKMRTIGAHAYGPMAEAFLLLLGSGGKRLRPALALAAYGFYADRASEKAIAVAAAVETLHTATLVHDDLIDEALVRHVDREIKRQKGQKWYVDPYARSFGPNSYPSGAPDGPGSPDPAAYCWLNLRAFHEWIRNQPRP